MCQSMSNIMNRLNIFVLQMNVLGRSNITLMFGRRGMIIIEIM